jgi:signal transduction histidine kinase
MAETIFEELKRYVGFEPADEVALRGFHAAAQPHFGAIADRFYERILAHDGARKALAGGESQVGHLKTTLKAWMDRLLSGPWDEAYYELRCRIGRVHVRIALPQHYMFGAMNVVRREMNQLIDTHYVGRPGQLAEARTAVGKILDMELAIMLHTYREDLLSQQARAERLATFGQLVGSIGHELRNPLGVIESSLYLLRQRMERDERTGKHLDRIQEQLLIANGIITDLLDMIRDRPGNREALYLPAVVDAALAAVHRPEGAGLELQNLVELPKAKGDAGQLRQVFLNLLENAFQAAGPRGRVSVSGEVLGGNVAIAIADDGPGVDPSVRARLFEPLITTKEKGIGLGLALVKRLVERHGGTITYEPPPTGGARFVVRLPIA